jgi:hypothetical protein
VLMAASEAPPLFFSDGAGQTRSQRLEELTHPEPQLITNHRFRVRVTAGAFADYELVVQTRGVLISTSCDQIICDEYVVQLN